MDVQSIIANRRDGKIQSREEFAALACGAADGTIPDYQLAAWLMAAYLKPLNPDETALLTLAMADSGERLDLTGLPKPWVDKHSTGGVGDKTSIVLLPTMATCGVTLVKMSGRGLGLTGGTVDKLASIPGLRLDLSPEEMKAEAKRIGLALTGQTPNLAPADKVLYGLRDVTGTVSSIPLIVSSVLSKKIAAGAETIVLDVKCGSGSFMPTREQADALATALDRTAKLCGLNTRIAVSDMSQPLGNMVGNALEVKEAIRVLSGEQSRFSRLCVEMGGLILEASGLQPNRESGREATKAAIASGKALEKARQWFLTQGATVDVIEDSNALPVAPLRRTIRHFGAPGWIERLDAASVGQALLDLGGGRHQKTDVIDPSVGIELHMEVGSKIESGQELLTIHAADEAGVTAVRELLVEGITVSDTEISKQEALLKVL